MRPPAALRRPRLEGDAGRRVRGEAADRRGLDQRRLLRPRRPRCSTTFADDQTLWEREPARAARREGPADGLPARGLLPADGHAAATSHYLETLWSSRQRRPGRCGRDGLELLAGPADARHRRDRAGRRLARRARLVDAGADVVCLVRDWVPQSELVRSGHCSTGSRVVRGDVRDQALLERVLGEYEIDTVFHLAAQTIVGIANRNPVSTFETNIRRHLGAARGLPPQPARRSRSSSPRPTRPTATRSSCPYDEEHAARRAGTPTTSASRAPT